MNPETRRHLIIFQSTPSTEGDYSDIGWHLQVWYFNPRPLRRATGGLQSPADLHLYFNPRPLRRATSIYGNTFLYDDDFNPRPLRRATPLRHLKNPFIVFQSTPSTEGDNYYPVKNILIGVFQSTPSTEGDVQLICNPVDYLNISIHALYGGRQLLSS